MNKILERSIQIMTWTMMTVLVIVAALTVGVRLVGLTPYVVVSGSMEPVFPTGSIIYVQKVDPQTIGVGDPITFRMREGDYVAVHRVYDIREEDRSFITKGDQNDAVDGSPVNYSDVIGAPRFTIPKAGFLYRAITSSPGRYLFLGLVALTIALMFTSEYFKEKNTKIKTKGDPDASLFI